MAARALTFSNSLCSGSRKVLCDEHSRKAKVTLYTNKTVVASSSACRLPASRRSVTQRQRLSKFQLHATTEEAPAEEAPVEIDADDRSSMYASFVAAKDKPEWLPAKFVGSVQLSEGVRNIVLEIEASREFVKIENSYMKVGQRAQLKVGPSGSAEQAVISSSPIDPNENSEAWKILLALRGDIFAGSTKTIQEDMNLPYPLELLVSEAEQPELYNLAEDSEVEVGPFTGGGLLLKNVHGVYRHKTLLIFASGKGQAAARAVLNAEGQKGLNLKSREQSRAYFLAESEEELYYQDETAGWEEKHSLDMRVATGTSLRAMFDDDDLEYDPEYTGAVVICDTPEEEQELRSFLESEGELSSDSIVLSCEEDAEIVLLKATTDWQKME